jgi:hypothetical protein
MKTHLSSMAALLLVALFVVPARAEFDYYANFSADEAADTLSATADDKVPAELDYIEATYRETSWLGDAAQQDDGCKGGCDCCPGIAPNMIGDSIGVPIGVSADGGFTVFGLQRHFAKVSENNNVLPQNRISATSNYYFDVATSWGGPFGANGVVLEETDIHEHKLYLEKAFGCGNWSVNLTVPVYHTVEFQQTAAPFTEEGWEFGNLSFGFKRVLMRGCNGAVSGGLLVEAPTARDSGFPGFGQFFRNSSWFLTPYVGAQYTPNDRLFAQMFASYRFRTGRQEGVGFADQIQSDRLMLDAGVGYWLWRNDCCRFVTGLAPTVELHYTTFTEDQDPTSFTSFYYNRVDMLNLTAGVTAELANGVSVALAAALPLRAGTFPGGNLETDEQMDWELILQANKRF